MPFALIVLGLTVLASGHADAQPSSGTLSIEVDGTGHVTAPAQTGKIFMSGQVDDLPAWRAFLMQLMNETNIEPQQNEGGWVFYPPLSGDHSTASFVSETLTGTPEEIETIAGAIEQSDFAVRTDVNWRFEPTQEHQERVVQSAIEDARAKADLTARAAGCSLLNLSTVQLHSIDAGRQHASGELFGIEMESSTSALAQQHQRAADNLPPTANLSARIGASFAAEC